MKKSRKRADTMRENHKKQYARRVRNVNGSLSLDLSTEPERHSDPKTDGKKNLHYMKDLVKEKGVVK